MEFRRTPNKQINNYKMVNILLFSLGSWTERAGQSQRGCSHWGQLRLPPTDPTWIRSFLSPRTKDRAQPQPGNKVATHLLQCLTCCGSFQSLSWLWVSFSILSKALACIPRQRIKSTATSNSDSPWDKAAQEALERAADKAFSPGLPSLWNILWRTGTSKPLGTLQTPPADVFTLFMKGPSHVTPSSALCVDFVEDNSTSTMIVLQHLKMEGFFGGMLLPLKCTHTLSFSPSVPFTCGWMKTMSNSHSGNKTTKTPVDVSPWNPVANPTPGVFPLLQGTFGSLAYLPCQNSAATSHLP